MAESAIIQCGCGEIGRRAGFRFLWETIWVRVPSSAPTSTLVGAFFVGADEGLTRFHRVRKMLAFSLSEAKAPFIRTKKQRYPCG